MGSEAVVKKDSVRYVWTKYDSKPVLPPAFATFGKVRYARWDGGSIAALKATKAFSCTRLITGKTRQAMCNSKSGRKLSCGNPKVLTDLLKLFSKTGF